MAIFHREKSSYKLVFAKMQKLRQKLLDKHTEGTMCHNCFHNSQEGFQPLDETLSYPLNFDTLYEDFEWEERKNKL